MGLIPSLLKGSAPVEPSKYPFIAAANFTKGRQGIKPRLIIIHTAETPESEGRSKQVAAFFTNKKVEASAHYTCDDKTIVKSVMEADTAWAVDDWDLNLASISVEHAGAASQSAGQWLDTYSEHELALSATLTADIAHRWGIPVKKLTPAEILAGASGFAGHVDVTIAKKVKNGHTDPGTFFPWEHYLALVTAINSIPK